MIDVYRLRFCYASTRMEPELTPLRLRNTDVAYDIDNKTFANFCLIVASFRYVVQLWRQIAMSQLSLTDVRILLSLEKPSFCLLHCPYPWFMPFGPSALGLVYFSSKSEAVMVESNEGIRKL